MMPKAVLLLAVLVAFPVPRAEARDAKRKNAAPPPAPVVHYEQPVGSPGSIYAEGSRFENLATDPRATRRGDLVTILVSDRASANSTGVTKSSRQSSAKYSVGSIFGPMRVAGPLTELAKASGERDLQGEGQTGRTNSISTTLTVQVVDVLPNGVLVLDGAKSIQVNSENHVIRVRGAVRPIDLSRGNTVVSDRISGLEIELDGKGVVSDSIKRPFILYRILMGLLPF